MRDNDLIWIGKAARCSAEFSDVQDTDYQTHISSRVHAMPNKAAEFDADGKSLWTATSFDMTA